MLLTTVPPVTKSVRARCIPKFIKRKNSTPFAISSNVYLLAINSINIRKLIKCYGI